MGCLSLSLSVSRLLPSFLVLRLLFPMATGGGGGSRSARKEIVRRAGEGRAHSTRLGRAWACAQQGATLCLPSYPHWSPKSTFLWKVQK